MIDVREFLNVFFVISLSVFVASCGDIDVNAGSKTGLESIKIVSDLDMNNSSTTTVDFVFLYDKRSTTALPESSIRWFNTKDRIVSAHRDAIEVISIDVKPAKTIERLDLPKRFKEAIHVVAYANYTSFHGQHKIDLTRATNAVVNLKRKDMKLFEERAFLSNAVASGTTQ